MSHQPNNLSAGTQVVSLIEVRGTNDSQVQRTISDELALEIVRVRLATSFAAGRHARRGAQTDQEPQARRAPGLLATQP